MKSISTFISLVFLSAFAQNLYSANECYPVQYDVDEEWKLKVYGEYLYWQVIQDQMQYAGVLNGGAARLIEQIGGPFDNLIEQARVVEPHFKWNSGFRVGFILKDSCSSWDLDASYTRFDYRQKSHTMTSGHQILPLSVPASAIFAFINQSNSANIQFGVEASSDWHFNYNVADVTLGRGAYFWSDFAFRPYVGVKGAWILQKQFVQYFGNETRLSKRTPFIPVTVDVIKRNHFRAVGPSIGVDNSWGIGCGFSLTSGVSGALVYGRIHVEEIPHIGIASHDIKVTLHTDKLHRLKPTVDGYIGLDWTGSFDGFGVVAGVSYEVQHWWNHWNAPGSGVSIILTGGQPPIGDLSLHGLNAHVAITF